MKELIIRHGKCPDAFTASWGLATELSLAAWYTAVQPAPAVHEQFLEH